MSNMRRTFDERSRVACQVVSQEGIIMNLDTLDLWILQARSIRQSLGLPMRHLDTPRIQIRDTLLEALKPMIKGLVRDILREGGRQ